MAPKTTMIPTPPRPGDIPPGPEEPTPRVRGGEPLNLVFQALEEVGALRTQLEDLAKKVDTLERRVAALEKPAP